MKLIFGHDAEMAAWAQKRIEGVRDFNPCRAIGVSDGEYLLAAVVYNDYQPQLGTCSISIAADSPRWATKGAIRSLLSVPFMQYNVRKLYSQIDSTNKRCLRFNLGLGFKQEAVLRHHYGRKRHCIVTSMMAHEYLRLWGGEKIVLTPQEKCGSNITG